MSERREIAARKALRRKAAAEKSAAIYERITSVVDKVHLMLTEKDFAHVLRGAGLHSVPGCLRRPPANAISNLPLEKDPLGEISLEFVVVWKFLFPLLETPAMKNFLELASPGFVLQFKDAFITLVTEGPFPIALSGHVGNLRGPQHLRRGRRRSASLGVRTKR